MASAPRWTSRSWAAITSVSPTMRSRSAGVWCSRQRAGCPAPNKWPDCRSRVDHLRRRRARLLIRRGQPFADEALFAAANFTWVGNSMGAQPGAAGRGDWAGGLPTWTLVGAGTTRLFVIAADHMRPDKGESLIGSWPLTQVRLTEESHGRKAGPIPLGAWRAIRFEFPDRDDAVLQPFGREADDL